MLVRDNMLVTAGARAAYMDMNDDICLPSGVEGEHELTKFITKAVRTYIKLPEDIPFDEFIETELVNEFGTGKGKHRAIFDKETAEWFKSHPDAQTTVTRCEKCGLYYKPILGHKCNKKGK